jgi:hypothetical protein
MAEGAFNTVFIVLLVLGLLATGYLTYAPLKKRCEALYECKQNTDQTTCDLVKKQRATEDKYNALINDLSEVTNECNQVKKNLANTVSNLHEAFTHTHNDVNNVNDKVHRVQEEIENNVRNALAMTSEHGPWSPPEHAQKDFRRYNRNKCEVGRNLVTRISKHDTHQNRHRKHAICKMKAAGFCDYFGGSKCFKKACKKNGMKCGFEETHQGVNINKLTKDYLRDVTKDSKYEGSGPIDVEALIDETSEGGIGRRIEGYAAEFEGHKEKGCDENSLDTYQFT